MPKNIIPAADTKLDVSLAEIAGVKNKGQLMAKVRNALGAAGALFMLSGTAACAAEDSGAPATESSSNSSSGEDTIDIAALQAEADAEREAAAKELEEEKRQTEAVEALEEATDEVASKEEEPS